MPAAAVTPAPIAYIKVVAVKKLVVGYLAWAILVRLSASRWASVYRVLLLPSFWILCSNVKDLDLLL